MSLLRNIQVMFPLMCHLLVGGYFLCLSWGNFIIDFEAFCWYLYSEVLIACCLRGELIICCLNKID